VGIAVVEPTRSYLRYRARELVVDAGQVQAECGISVDRAPARIAHAAVATERSSTERPIAGAIRMTGGGSVSAAGAVGVISSRLEGLAGTTGAVVTIETSARRRDMHVKAPEFGKSESRALKSGKQNTSL
jgi:hypothetical protein